MPPDSALVAVPYLVPFLTLFRLARKTPDLATVEPLRGPFVSIIIPARNEAATIATVVESVLESDYDPFELLVVDDRSTDRTGAILDEISRRSPRLRVIRGADLPDGWYGKAWACEQGYRAAQGDLLLFTDADTHHEPGLLGRAVGAMAREWADLVTVAPEQQCLTFWERVVMPQVWWFLAVRFHPDRVNHATRARDVIANGQFILVRRSAYELAGTHAAVRGEVAEDLALAQAFFRAGRKLHFVFALDLMQTRMYRNLAALVEGWSKNIYLGGRRSFPDNPWLRSISPLLTALPLVFWLVPPLGLVAIGLGLVAGNHLLGTALATLLSVLFWASISFGMHIPLWYGLCYPAGAGMTLFIVIRSTLRGGKRVEWRGRRYGERD
jgi:chlorobactene glucosyltransferase